MAMAEVEHNWSVMEEQVVYTDVEYGGNVKTDFEKYPTIVVESNQLSGSVGSDAPIVIYPNDPSVVGAEEVVMGEQVVDMQWSLPPEAEEVVVPSSSERHERSNDDIGEIHDETYATYHPFPCDFCSRRFKKKANLINHMVAHQTQRPHGCAICSSRFMRKCDLVNHMKIHSYVPNRENRDDIKDIFRHSHIPKRAETKTTRGRRKTAMSPRRPPPRKRDSPDPYLSPATSPDPLLKTQKPTSYVDEDVQLLLEMTTKLHESRQSEGDVTNAPLSSSPEPRKAAGSSDKPYVCNVCQRCFARESALVSHSQVHAEDSAYDCNKCGSRFFTVDLLRDHYTKKHHTTYSEEMSDDQAEEGRSERVYTGDERFGTFYCHICAQSFHRLEQLKLHKRTLHSRDYDGLYRCCSCQSMFITNEKLLEHLDSSPVCQKHVCLLCGEHFGDQTAVAAHIKVKHSRDMPLHTCPTCGKQCCTPSALKKHSWTHFSDRKYSCRRIECQKKFNSWGKLKRHMLSHTEKSLNCDMCEEEFTDKRALLEHRNTHEFGNAQRRFICNECGKSFGSRSSQQIHTRIHTGERPYGCRYCWKAFADGGTLRKHERIHTGEKPYACAVCPRAFNQRVVLRDHIRSHHSSSSCQAGFDGPVFLCPVCKTLTSCSEELALHIVKHCDENTLRNRIPTTGARSYKRRRKPETSKFYSLAEFDEADFFDNNSESESEASENVTSRRQMGRSKRTYNYNKSQRNIDTVNSIVEPPRKAKMINTKLQPSAGRPGKRGVKRRGRRAVEVTVVSKPRTRTLSGRLSGRWDRNTEEPLKENNEPENQRELPQRMVRPRTKNVNYETLRALREGLPAATFPGSVKQEVKVEVKEENVDSVTRGNCEDDDDQRSCGICGQVFSSRADLLGHVPVHI